MATKFWLHTQESTPDYCPHCGEEYDSIAADHGEAGTREVAVGEATKTVQMYRCTQP